MDNLWNRFLKFIDGNKTILGLVLVQLSSAPFIPDSWISSIEWLGTILTSIGVIHKVGKGYSEIRNGKANTTIARSNGSG